MFLLVVLAHTDEQWINLQNTRESIIVINVRLSNRYFTWLFDKGYLNIWKLLELHVRHMLDYSPL